MHRANTNHLPSVERPGFTPDTCARGHGDRGDIVIVGAGLAGLFTALKLPPRPVTVIAAAPMGEGASSAWAQGGIAAAVGEGDTPKAHARDTIEAGAGLVDATVAEAVANQAPQRIRDLLAFGVPFDKDLAGEFMLSKEAAHSAARVVRVSGDQAGGAIMQALIAEVRRTRSVRVLEGFSARDLVMEDGRVRGVRLVRLPRLGNGHYDLIPARAVILATGGVGGLYRVMTNPPHARGEGIGMAARAGAVIADAEFVQFHPTALDVPADPSPLITEALRGEGATLINRDGKRFMTALHPDAELAPRDIVARGVFEEIAAGRGAYLDCRKAIGSHFAERFPTVHASCRAAGLDPETDILSVAPAAHYHMGGIATDLNGRSTVPGVWALGEVASTGLHGANRLASNSLLEAIVMGARIARDVAGCIPAEDHMHATLEPRIARPGLPAGERKQLIDRLRDIMSRHVGVIRDATGLARAHAEIADLHAKVADSDSGLTNITVAAAMIAHAAAERRESRGAHARSDFPDSNPQSAIRAGFTLTDLDLAVEATAPTAGMTARGHNTGLEHVRVDA